MEGDSRMQISKITLITRQDLSAGYQASQLTHAITEFIFQHYDKAKHWHETSRYVVCLSAKDENHLKDIIAKLNSKGICYSIFREPDIDNQITSIAIEHHTDLKRITSSLPLALKEYSAGINKHNFQQQIV